MFQRGFNVIDAMFFSHMKAILDEDEFIAEAGSGGCVVSPII